jgi:hypothetical protein
VPAQARDRRPSTESLIGFTLTLVLGDVADVPNCSRDGEAPLSHPAYTANALALWIDQGRKGRDGSVFYELSSGSAAARNE